MLEVWEWGRWRGRGCKGEVGKSKGDCWLSFLSNFIILANEDGSLHGFLRFALDPSPWLSIVTLVGTLGFAAYCLWLNQQQEKARDATEE